MKRLLHLLPFLLLLSSCTKELPQSSIVTYKVYEPRREYSTQSFMMVGNAMVPITYHHADDEDYVLYLHNTDTSDHYHYKAYVSKEVYESFNVGDRCDNSLQCEMSDHDEKHREGN